MAQAAPQTAKGCFVPSYYAPAVEAGGKSPESKTTKLASAWPKALRRAELCKVLLGEEYTPGRQCQRYYALPLSFIEIRLWKQMR
ncbi:MAG: hypothetical protein FWD16_06700 [Clostridia bacterium]|nr:hypothetical protein [Clostridia bacterium]